MRPRVKLRFAAAVLGIAGVVALGFVLVLGHQRLPGLPRTVTITPYTDQIREVWIHSEERRPQSPGDVLRG